MAPPPIPTGNSGLQQAGLLMAHGTTQQAAGNLQGAVRAFQQAIRVAPLNAGAYRALLDLLLSAGDLTNAQRVVEAVPVEVYRQSALIRYLHARLLLQQGQPGRALSLLEELKGQPEIDAAGHAFNTGLSLALLGRYADALPAYERAFGLGLRADWLSFNWARAAHYVGDHATAERLYRELTRAHPDNISYKYELAIVLLKTGQFSTGFRLYQHRWSAGLPQFQNSGARLIGLPQWNGRKPVRLLVTREQGIGEQLVFSALLPAVERQVEHLAVGFDPRLAPLIRRTWPGVEFVAQEEPLDAIRNRFDACISAADMGALVPEAIGWKDGYLQPDRERALQLRDKYHRQFPGKKLIGISWMSKQSALSEAKSMDLLEWRRLLEQKDCQFISLQYGKVDADLATAREMLDVAIYQDPEIDSFHDLDGLAAQAAALDLVISTSNSTAHIAAATGARTWLILPAGFGSLWYWGHKDSHCAWYPDLRLFRAPREGDWTSVMTEVAAALQQECGVST